MPTDALIGRVRILEQKVDALDRLPARMDAIGLRMDALELQILQFREEVRVEFSAVRQEMADLGSSLRQELGAEIRTGDEETRRYMRVLHEDVISRIALLQESPRRPRKR